MILANEDVWENFAATQLIKTLLHHAIENSSSQNKDILG